MRTTQTSVLAFVMTAASLPAQPLINLVVNSASGIPAGLPNAAIAQGSLFRIWGVGLGPKTFQFASPPFPTALAGTSITITVNGTTVTAPMYYTGFGQAGAVLPSNTPAGDGTLTLTYNGASGSSPITVVPANFGIANAAVDVDNADGVLNLAVVTFPNYQYVRVTNTAKPGDILTVWGTGLGATPNNGGDTDAGPVANIGNAPLVFVGGIASPSVTYWGRSPNSIPGLDQINFVVPPNAPLGCNVSIIVQTTPLLVSNAPTIALAATDGATCSDPTQILPPFLSKSGFKVVFVGLQQNVSIRPNSNGTTTTTTTSSANVQFDHFTQILPVATTEGEIGVSPSLGNCYTGYLYGGDEGLPVTPLDAGTSVTLTPPSGNALTLTHPNPNPGSYASANSSTTLPSGTWSFSNGSGGSDVGPLSFTFQVPHQVTWTNQAAVSASPIDRANPLTITWSGGDSNGYVHIVGIAGAADFECSAPATAGQFTIPPSILLSMLAGVPANLAVSTQALPFSLGTVPGVDVAEDLSMFQTSVPVVFQ